MDLRAKKLSIHHSEMLSKLMQNSLGRDLGVHQGDGHGKGGMDKHAGTGLGCKRDGVALSDRHGNTQNWKIRTTGTQKLKEAVEKPLKQARFPTFTKILQFWKSNTYNIYPRGSEVCAPNSFLGRCFHENKCTKLHKLAEDCQIPDILKILDPFIKFPKKVKTSQVVLVN